MPRTHRPYPPEFRLEAVRLARGSDTSIPALAADLGVSSEALRHWLRQADADEGRGRPGPPASTGHQLLMTVVDRDPLVWGPLAVASTVTLATLHRVLQAALGRTNRHPHQFVAADTAYGDPALLGQVAPAVGAVSRYAYDRADG